MEHSRRKPTRLREYNYSENGTYFVTICTKDKRPTLCNIVGGGTHDAPQIQLTAIGCIVEKYIQSTNQISAVTVDEYVIMPNHVHLLLSINHGDGTSWAPSPTSTMRANQILPHAISTLKRLVNRDVGYHVWQRSFHDHVVRGEQDYREIWNYIDQNPLRWREDELYNGTLPD